MGSYSAKSKNGDESNKSSSFKNGIKQKAGSAALQSVGVPKPLADLASKKLSNNSLNIPGGKNPFGSLNSKANKKSNEAGKKSEAADAKDKEKSKDLKSSIKNKAKNKLLGKDDKDSKSNVDANSDGDADVFVNVKSTIVKASISVAVFLVFLPFFLVLSVIAGIESAYGSYNGEDNLYKLNQTNNNISSSSEINMSGTSGQFYAPIQGSNIKMYGANSTNSGFNHDISASSGTKVYSPADGEATFKTITKNGKIASYGNVVYIKTSDGYEFRLGHLKSMEGISLKYGSSSNYPSSCFNSNCKSHVYTTKRVSKGEVVGTVGASGNARGAHLHFEVWVNGKRVAPEKYVGY